MTRKVSIAELIGAGEADVQTGPFGTQLKASEYTSTGVPVINVRNIGFGDVRTEKLEYVSASTRDRLSAHVLRESDIVFGRKGAVERHMFVRAAQDGWIQGSDCIRLRLKTQRFNPRFVSYCLLTPEHQQWMANQCSHAATMASLNQGIVSRIELPAISRADQDHVVSILAAYDDLIENCERRIRVLDEMARALYREWFVDFRFPGHEKVSRAASRQPPSGWGKRPLRELTTKIGSGSTPRGGKESYKSEGIALIRSLNIYDYRFEFADLAFIDHEQALDLEHVTVQPRDVLLNITGASVGRCTMVPAHVLPGRVNQHVAIIRAKPSEMDPYYLLDTINADTNKRALLGIAQGGATREALTKETIANFDVLVPPKSLLEQYGQVAGPMHDARDLFAQRVRTLRKSRDLLLPRLLSGQLSLEQAA